nr:MAG TPA: hypothetical protein [Caudoviricetes sp.]
MALCFFLRPIILIKILIHLYFPFLLKFPKKL